ncbi:MAG: hypothetical protein WCG25_06475 [bacterium]
MADRSYLRTGRTGKALFLLPRCSIPLSSLNLKYRALKSSLEEADQRNPYPPLLSNVPSLSQKPDIDILVINDNIFHQVYRVPLSLYSHGNACNEDSK